MKYHFIGGEGGYSKREDLGNFQLSGKRFQNWKMITLMGGCDYSVHYAAFLSKLYVLCSFHFSFVIICAVVLP